MFLLLDFFWVGGIAVNSKHNLQQHWIYKSNIKQFTPVMQSIRCQQKPPNLTMSGSIAANHGSSVRISAGPEAEMFGDPSA